jgi:hypothetical protein
MEPGKGCEVSGIVAKKTKMWDPILSRRLRKDGVRRDRKPAFSRTGT